MYIAPGKPIYNWAGELQGVWMASLNLSIIGDSALLKRRISRLV
jgi:hypothetical protein